MVAFRRSGIGKPVCELIRVISSVNVFETDVVMLFEGVVSDALGWDVKDINKDAMPRRGFVDGGRSRVHHGVVVWWCLPVV